MKNHEITTADARKLLTPNKEPYYRQEGSGSIGFRCTGPNGTGTFIGRIRVNGKYEYNPFDRLRTYREAQDRFREWEKEIEQARTAGVPKTARNATVGDAAERHLANKLKVHGKSASYNTVKSNIERCLIGRKADDGTVLIEPNPMAAIQLSKLTKADFMAFRASLIQGRDEVDVPRSQLNSASRYFADVKSLLNAARKDGLVASDAAWALVPDFGDNSPMPHESYRYITLPERSRILQALPTEDMKNFFLVLTGIGCRPVELLRAKVGDYDKRTKLLRLVTKKGKGKPRPRFVPVGQLNVAHLVEAQTKSKMPMAPLFDFNYAKLKRTIRATVDDLDIDNASSYCMRHSFITDSVNANVPLTLIAQITGTSAVWIEKTYCKTLPEAVERSFAKLKFA